MKKINSTLILILFMNLIYAQNPLVKQWDYQFGGTDNDVLFSFHQTSDRGYILGGFSSSGISGDKTQNVWGGTGMDRDYWIVKIDSLGNKQWDKDFGGTELDVLNAVQQTADGGYILGGTSWSGLSGDKTQPLWDTCINCNKWDYWIVKTDSLGNKQWDKDFGGTNLDNFTSLVQTIDGGYLLGGYSKSGISGNKSEPNWDSTGSSYDYWILKIDSLGNKQWDKVFGGTSWDYLLSLQQTADGGYILGGSSMSDTSGDKTQPLWDTCTNCLFKRDYWIVKTDSLGNKIWDKDYGGYTQDYLTSLQQTADGGYILGGISQSGTGGDKTQPLWDTCINCIPVGDFWIIKIDSSGNKQWDRDFGGTLAEDELGNVIQTLDGGYIMAGSSYSAITGNKNENNLGEEQGWIVKTDSLGNFQWDKTIFTTGHDEQERVIQLHDGCYAIVNSTYGGIAGYKTQPNWDTACNSWCTNDYWIIKFCDTTSAASLQEINSVNLIEVNPNPITDKLNFTVNNSELTEIILYDIASRKLWQKKFMNSTTLNTEQLSKGIYIYEVRNKDGSCKKGKVVKD